MPRDSYGAMRAPLLRITDADAQAIANAVQWAGHFTRLANCRAGGPAITDVARATRALEACGFTIPHCIETRAAIEATQ